MVEPLEGGDQIRADVADDVDRGDRGVPTLEDTILHLFDVQLATPQDVEHSRQHADAIEVANVEGVGAEPGGREVHTVEDLAPDERIDDLDDPLRDRLLRLRGRRPDVMRPHDVGMLGELRGPIGGARAGFVGVDIETRAKRAGLERIQEGGLVHDVSPGRVEEDRALLHPAEHPSVEHRVRLGRRGHMDRDDVGRRHQLLERVLELDAERSDALLGRLIPILADRPHVEPERGGAFGDREPDLAQADDAHHLPEEAVGFGVGGLVPGAGSEVGHVVGDPPVDREEQPHRELSHRDRVAARDVRHVDPDLGCRVHVDRVRARPGPHDQLERVRRLDRGGCHFRAPHDERLEAGDPIREVVGRELRIRDTVVAAVGQHAHGGRVDGIGQENPHRLGAKQNGLMRNKPGPLTSGAVASPERAGRDPNRPCACLALSGPRCYTDPLD